MEAFEQFVALALEDEGFVVSGGLKFPVKRQTAKTAYAEFQKHGFEVDLVGARSDCLVLATVKSFFGSRGVVAEHVKGTSASARGNRGYALLNEPIVRKEVVTGAAERFGYSEQQIELRLYVGHFARKDSEGAIRDWFDTQLVGSGPIQLVGAKEVVETVRRVARKTEYRDSAVLATLKVLEASGALKS